MSMTNAECIRQKKKSVLLNISVHFGISMLPVHVCLKYSMPIFQVNVSFNNILLGFMLTKKDCFSMISIGLYPEQKQPFSGGCS